MDRKAEGEIIMNVINWQIENNVPVFVLLQTSTPGQYYVYDNGKWAFYDDGDENNNLN